jgi:hypothetical protein
MPEETSNFTIRLPDELRKRLQIQADDKRRTLSAHILRLLEVHMVQAGFGETMLTSPSGRVFEVTVETAQDDMQQTTCIFWLNELKFDKHRAHYMIGVRRDVLEDWHVSDRVSAVKEVGLALLTYFNRSSEVDCLKWNLAENAEFDGRRILGAADVGARTLSEFLDKVQQGHWQDKHLQRTEKSQDIRRGRSESALYQ